MSLESNTLASRNGKSIEQAILRYLGLPHENDEGERMILDGTNIQKCCATCIHVEGDGFTSRYEICVCGREKDRRVNNCAGSYCTEWREKA